MYELRGSAAYEELLDYAKTVPIFDTHEHLPGTESLWREQRADVITEFLRHYFNVDIVGAGLPVEKIFDVWNVDIPFMDRWRMIERHWENARRTGYGRSVELAARDVYGIDKVCSDTIEELNRRFLAAKSAPGHYRRVIKDMSGVEISMLDTDLNCDRSFFRSVWRMDSFVQTDIDAVERMEKKHNAHVTCLADWVELAEKDMDDALAAGAVALKCGLAYRRPLFFDRATTAQAEEQFMPRSEIYEANRSHFFGREFQNYMMHRILRMADERGLVYQFHTGLQEGNRNLLNNSDPSLLNNLFNEYRGIKFDIFHIGFPFQEKLVTLVKYYTNVYIDMAWAHIVSPAACISGLREWLDTIPENKIFGFGGDYALPDGVYGHTYIARRNIAKALSLKVDDGLYGMDEAKACVRKLLHDNAANVFNIK